LALASTKEQLRELIEHLPDDCTLEDVQYHLYVQQKVGRGLEDVRHGRVLSQEEVERRMTKWTNK
jgi:predicted transcriptional regulator